MPTPTPIPSSQIVQAVQATQNIIDSAVQQGIVGVLLLISISAVFVSLGFAIRSYASRNAKPEGKTADSAVNALAEVALNRDAEAKVDREDRKAETAAWRDMIKDQNERFITAISHMGDRYNRLGDTLHAQTNLLATISSHNAKQTDNTEGIRQDLNKMVTFGSEPLQGLIETVGKIKDTVEDIQRNLLPCIEIKDLDEADKKMYQSNLDAVKADVEILKASMQGRIEEKRKGDTGESKAIDLKPETAGLN